MNQTKLLLSYITANLMLVAIVATAQTPQQIAKKALDATVLLVMEDADGGALGMGSGFFVRKGLVATNLHVIEDAAKGYAKRVGQDAKYAIEGITARDDGNDLVIIKVSALDVPALSLGDSDAVQVGESVYAVGNPRGLDGTFSQGVISSIREAKTRKRLQFTAPISPGSSGGPVLNEVGEVIGISVAIFRGGQNLNFAIPSNYLKALVVRSGVPKPFSQSKTSLSAETYFNRGIIDHSVGIVLDSPGKYRSAIAAYDTAIRLEPNNPRYYSSRGNAKVDLGQYFDAIADYDTAIRLKPDDADAYLNRGVDKGMLGQHFDAIKDYDAAIRLKPDDADAYLGRGNAKGKLGQHFDAIADYDTAIRLKPDYVGVYLNRGVEKGKLGQYFDAIADFDTAIRLKPDYTKAYANRGIAKEKLGQNTAAVIDYNTALNLAEDVGDTELSRLIKQWLRELR